MSNRDHGQRLAGRSLDAGALRAGGWGLIASFLTFALGVLVTVMTTGDRAQAEQAAADRLGVAIPDLPALELAKVSEQFPPTDQDVVNVLMLVAATAIFAVAIATARMGWLPTVLATLTPLGWSAYILFGTAVTSGVVPPESTLALYDRYALPAMAVSSAAGCLALIVVVLTLGSRDAGGRTGSVVLVLAALGAVAAVALGAPPVLPMFLGSILGITLVRSGRSDRVREAA